MRFFALLGLQHVVLYIFPTLIFILVFGSNNGLGGLFANFFEDAIESFCIELRNIGTLRVSAFARLQRICQSTQDIVHFL